MSELYAIATALRKLKYYRPFLAEMAIAALGPLDQIEPTPIYSDCDSAVMTAEGGHPARFKGTKHLERRFFGIQQAIGLKMARMARASSLLNAADIGATYKDVSNFVQIRNVFMANVYAPLPARSDAIVEI